MIAKANPRQIRVLGVGSSLKKNQLIIVNITTPTPNPTSLPGQLARKCSFINLVE